MVVDPRRDHSFRIPRPDLSVKMGTPNACNQCHDRKSAQWAADAVEKWYGPERRRETTYGELLWAGATQQPNGEAALIALANDAAQPSIAPTGVTKKACGVWQSSQYSPQFPTNR